MTKSMTKSNNKVTAARAMRQSTLETLGLGTVLDIFRNGRLPVETEDLVEEIFGKKKSRGSLVISGVNGIVGAGKAMQLGSRLEPYGVTLVGLDFPGAPDGVGKQFPGLVKAFGQENANRYMTNLLRFNYDGAHLPPRLKELQPRFLLEAIPEILDIKKAHYSLFRETFPGIEIRSVTSGFPASELGVGIAHPSYPHEINKIWEVVESEPSVITQLFWALGMIPIPVSDHWSFVLDVLFCGLLHSCLRYYQASNMPFWKMDKYIRKLLGPNPFRAHDAIGAQGANFLTWSCLHHLGKQYGELFKPTSVLDEHRESGEDWYPLDHFRPLIDWSLDKQEDEELKDYVFGALFQMTSLLLHEKRSHLSHINAIGELCAQFRRGILAVMRSLGPENVKSRVKSYQKLHRSSAGKCWYPKAVENMDAPEWKQLYVNAEHDGEAGVITISRESYNNDLDGELNLAIDWLKKEGIRNVIVTSDFHLSTQMVGADTSEFFSALDKFEEGFRVSNTWSATARRLNDEFDISVGFISGKRCLGGFLELLTHCHYLIAVEDARLGMPEVTLPVVPGMEGCHWPFRKARQEDWRKILHMLLSGKQVGAKEGVGWLIDYAGPLEDALKMAWKVVKAGDHGLSLRRVEKEAMRGVPGEVGGLPVAESPAVEESRRAIVAAVQSSCAAPLGEAVIVQAKKSAEFMTTPLCRKGRVGAECQRVMRV